MPPPGTGTSIVSRGSEAKPTVLFTGSIPATMTASVRNPLSPPRTRTVNGRFVRSEVRADGIGLGLCVGEAEGVTDGRTDAAGDGGALAGAADTGVVGAGLPHPATRTASMATNRKRRSVPVVVLIDDRQPTIRPARTVGPASVTMR